VDWYHAVGHLAEAARLLKGEGTLAAKQWFNRQERALFQGHAERIAYELSVAAQQPDCANQLHRQVGHFLYNRRRMNYNEMREDGWLVSSGMVEGSAKRKASFAPSPFLPLSYQTSTYLQQLCSIFM
jgi:hypothetical protein